MAGGATVTLIRKHLVNPVSLLLLFSFQVGAQRDLTRYVNPFVGTSGHGHTFPGAGFLQDVGSWIWIPRRVEMELSTDGKTFGPLLSIVNDVSERQEGVVIRDFVTTIQPQNARYVRIRAVNFGKIPSWHPGSGGDAWIFVDEILVK